MHVCGHSVAAQTALWKLGNLLCQQQCLFKGAACFHNLVGQAHVQRLMGMDGTPGQNHVHRAALADDARQTHSTTVNQRHPPTPAIDAKHRRLTHHPHIRPARQLQSACHRMALDGSNDRLGQQHPRRPHGSITRQRVRQNAGFGKRALVRL